MRGVKTRSAGKWKKFLISFCLLFLVVVLLNSVFKVYQKKRAAEEVLARMQSELKTLEDREKFLGESLRRLSTEEGLKFEIRKKLNVAEAGESVAIIVAEDPSVASSSPQISTWQKFKTFWFNLFE